MAPLLQVSVPLPEKLYSEMFFLQRTVFASPGGEVAFFCLEIVSRESVTFCAPGLLRHLTVCPLYKSWT